MNIAVKKKGSNLINHVDHRSSTRLFCRRGLMGTNCQCYRLHSKYGFCHVNASFPATTPQCSAQHTTVFIVRENAMKNTFCYCFCQANTNKSASAAESLNLKAPFKRLSRLRSLKRPLNKTLLTAQIDCDF